MCIKEILHLLQSLTRISLVREYLLLSHDALSSLCEAKKMGKGLITGRAIFVLVILHFVWVS